MKRVVYIELHGEKYPLCFSLGALEEFQQEFGGIQQFHDATIKNNDILTYIKALEILMRYGVARVRRFENPEAEGLSHEDIMETLDVNDIPTIATAVWDAIGKSQKNEVAGKSNSKKKVTE